ncbi:MAG TPA: hypothetical protein VIK03_01665, partial [Thermoleophilia bacterium]
PEPGESGDESTDYVRAKIATIRRNVRQFQTRHQSDVVEEFDGDDAGEVPVGAGEQDGPPAPEDSI